MLPPELFTTTGLLHHALEPAVVNGRPAPVPVTVTALGRQASVAKSTRSERFFPALRPVEIIRAWPPVASQLQSKAPRASLAARSPQAARPGTVTARSSPPW